MAKAGPRKKVPKELAVINADNCTGCESCLAKPPPDAHPPSAATTPTADAAKLLANVSLIPWTESRVAVSSTVDNPKDYPEHLLDGKLDTAWNGKTGDLTGFIAFRVPREMR